MIDIPISKLWVDDAVHDRVRRVLESGMVAQGPQVFELEQLVSGISGARHAIAVNNGTTALVLALEVLDLKPGDEVITTPFTFAATLNAIIESGATARFVDIDESFLLDASHLSEALTPNTKVVLPVHLYGQMADMDGITSALVSRPEVVVLEDAAQSIGAKFGGRGAGSFGLGTFSMYATKNVGSGEGGVVTTNDDLLAERMRILRNQGMKARYEYVVPGHNYRLTDLQAAVAIPQLLKIGEITSLRSANAAALTEGLSDVRGLVLPTARPNDVHVWNQYTVRLTESARLSRDELATALEAAGIGCGVYYPRMVFDYDCYRNHPLVKVEDMPRSMKACQEVLSLPVHPLLSQDQIKRIIQTVRQVLS